MTKKPSTLSVIMKRELKAYFTSPVAYIVTCLFLIINGVLFFSLFFVQNRADLSFQFCFSGFFTAYRKSILSFIHNVISVFTTRIPLCYLATIKYPENLFPMGMVAPLGSLLSTIICLIFFVIFFRKMKEDKI